jgi:TolB-like protein/DNA-binding SARP family transcriptional activator/Flp pilus assembly protein TadD
MLSLHFLGEVRAERGDERLTLPPSKKTRALLAYLAVTGRPQRRDRLSRLLWDVPDDPRGALRWSLSKIRGVVDEPGQARLLADRDTVRFDSSGTWIDVLELHHVSRIQPENVPAERLRALVAMTGDDFLAGHDFPENAEFQAWCLAQREEARTARAQVLTSLVEHLRPQPDVALPHARALVELQPNDERSWGLLVQLLVDADRRREAEEQLGLACRILDKEGVAVTGPLLKLKLSLKRPAPADTGPGRAEPTDRSRTLPLQPPGTLRRPSVAVLPIRSIGLDPALPYVADALSEDLVASLSRDRSLIVIADTGLGAIGNFSPGWREISDRAGAQYLVQGSVRHANGTLVVAVRLVNGRDGRLIWTERCVQRVDGSFAVDDLIARKIAAALQAEVEAIEIARAPRSQSERPDAKASYHMGLREMYQFTPAGLAAAQEHLERAVELDPTFAAGHARLSYVHIQKYWYGSSASRDDALTEAAAAANRAIGIDPKDSLGHFSLGRVHALRRQFDLAMPRLEAAVGLNPSHAQAYFGLGQSLWYAGRSKEAIRLLDTAIDLSPHDPHRWCFLHDQSEAYFALGQLADAERSAWAAASLPNATHWPWLTLAAVFGAAKKHDEAQEALGQLLQRRPSFNLHAAQDEFGHFSDKSFVAHYLDALKKAGLH